MTEPTPSPSRRIQRQITTLGHGLGRLLDAVEVLKRRVERGTVGDEPLRAWLKPWLELATAESPIHSDASTQVMWNDHEWRVVAVAGTAMSPAWGMVLMLLHLPALRSFWKVSMRTSRLRRLQAVLPRGWPLDPRIVPPGAVISGLGITSWDQLDQKLAQGNEFRALEAMGSGTVIALDASSGEALTTLLRAIPGERWVLVEVSSSGFDGSNMAVRWGRDAAGRVNLIL